MTAPNSSSSSRVKPRQDHGFTLIELMVALTGSLFFTIFVFMLSRDVSRFFQAQSRTSDTTLAAISGFERLRTDIARAGFLASPNLSRDINRCPRPTSGSTAAIPQQVGTQFDTYPGLQQMALLGIASSPAALTALPFYATLNNAKINPDVLTLYGNYASSEQFPVRSVDFDSNPVSIVLEQESPALLRVGVKTSTTDAAGTAILGRIFKAGGILRVVDETGRDQYSVINGVSFVSGVSTVTLSNALALVQKGNANVCGIRGHAAGLAINPVNIIRYAIVDVGSSFATHHPQLSYLFGGEVPPYDGTRLELMRYELPPTVGSGDSILGVNWPGTGTSITSMGELVAEYAVDLKFGLTVLSNTQVGGITTIAETASPSNYAGIPYESPANGQVSTSTTFGPHFIRGVHARLSVRYRDADRETSILADPSDPTVTAQQLFRVKVSATPEEFARTRSFRGYISTRNTQNSMWN